MKLAYIHVDLNTIQLIFCDRTPPVTTIQPLYISQNIFESDNYLSIRNRIPKGYFNCQWHINLKPGAKLYRYFYNEIQEELTWLRSLSTEEKQQALSQVKQRILDGEIQFTKKSDRTRVTGYLEEENIPKLTPLLTFIHRASGSVDYDWAHSFGAL